MCGLLVPLNAADVGFLAFQKHCLRFSDLKINLQTAFLRQKPWCPKKKGNTQPLPN